MTDNIENKTILEDKPSEEVKAPVAAADEGPTARYGNESRNFVWLAVISAVLTVGAWVAGGFNGILAIILCVAAIVAGSFSLKSRRHGIRNTAITSIIAAAVLLVVVSAFLMVIYIGLKSI